MISWALRYAWVARRVNVLSPLVVLDVGSSNYGLASCVKQPVQVVRVDVDFAPPHGLERQAAAQVVASAYALPFRSGAVPMAVSVDLFEHLGPGADVALAEMLRCATGEVVIEYPRGAAAKLADVAVALVCQVRGAPVPPWLVEHLEMESPSEAQLLAVASDYGYEVRGRASTGVLTELLGYLGDRVQRRVAVLSLVGSRVGTGLFCRLPTLVPYRRRMVFSRRRG